MSVVFTDEEIRALIVEPKMLSADYRSRLALRAKRGHREQELVVRSADEHEFHVILRQSTTGNLGTHHSFRRRLGTPRGFNPAIGVASPDFATG